MRKISRLIQLWDIVTINLGLFYRQLLVGRFLEMYVDFHGVVQYRTEAAKEKVREALILHLCEQGMTHMEARKQVYEDEALHMELVRV